MKLIMSIMMLFVPIFLLIIIIIDTVLGSPVTWIYPATMGFLCGGFYVLLFSK